MNIRPLKTFTAGIIMIVWNEKRKLIFNIKGEDCFYNKFNIEIILEN